MIKIKLIIRFIFLLLVANVFIVDSLADPLEKGNRILAIKANMGKSGDFEKIFNESVSAGSETQVLPQDWNELETSVGKFEPKTNFLAIANFYYPAHHTPIHLTIRPIHTNQKVVPSDLMDKPIDDPETIKRFKKLLDWIATQIPDVELTSLTIGSEIDIYAWGDEERWNEWINFYAAVTPYARKKFPDTLISCETTHSAFIGADLERVRRMHKYSDAIGISYYPMKNNLEGVHPPEVVYDDFKTIVEAIDKKPIIYYQIGYPSSSILGSSLEMQNAFISQAFKAWDKYSQRILMLNFQWMHETPEFGLDQYADYYDFDTPNFRAFLGSLGFKSWEGVPKPAWGTLKKEAELRGFGIKR